VYFKSTKTWLRMSMSVNKWDNSYEENSEKAQLNKCDLRVRLKAG